MAINHYDQQLDALRHTLGRVDPERMIQAPYAGGDYMLRVAFNMDFGFDVYYLKADTDLHHAAEFALSADETFARMVQYNDDPAAWIEVVE